MAVLLPLRGKQRPRTVCWRCCRGSLEDHNGGSQFKSIFDKHCQSIGARIDQTNPDVVYVGTGESNIRNTVSIGNGIYKTTDGGENWVFSGLPESEHISKLVIHPNDANTILLRCTGKLHSLTQPERGLYKSK